MTYNKLSPYATAIFSDDHYMMVVYHSTAIVKWNSVEIILNSGGWLSATTKKKMNQASLQFNLGFSVYQKDFSWFVDYDGQTVPFVDNMKLERKG
jgi:hypothetical protein